MAEGVKIPRGLVARNGWKWAIERAEYGQLGVLLFHQPFAHVEDRFSPGTLLQRWWSWQLSVSLWWCTIRLVRWRERTADQIQVPR